MRVTHFTQFEKDILCPKIINISNGSVFLVFYNGSALYLKISVFIPHLFCCYIYFSEGHKIPARVFQRGCGCRLHILPTLYKLYKDTGRLNRWATVIFIECSPVALRGYKPFRGTVVTRNDSHSDENFLKQEFQY